MNNESNHTNFSSSKKLSTSKKAFEDDEND
jgi:hypothetical protein